MLFPAARAGGVRGSRIPRAASGATERGPHPRRSPRRTPQRPIVVAFAGATGERALLARRGARAVEGAAQIGCRTVPCVRCAREREPERRAAFRGSRHERRMRSRSSARTTRSTRRSAPGSIEEAGRERHRDFITGIQASSRRDGGGRDSARGSTCATARARGRDCNRKPALNRRRSRRADPRDVRRVVPTTSRRRRSPRRRTSPAAARRSANSRRGSSRRAARSPRRSTRRSATTTSRPTSRTSAASRPRRRTTSTRARMPCASSSSTTSTGSRRRRS